MKKTGISAVMNYFGRKPGQSLQNFKHNEWDRLTDSDKEELIAACEAEPCNQ